MSGALGGGVSDLGNQLALMNPAAAAALRRAAYAQQLMAAGTEITPLRSGWQAAARAVSGLLGGYELNQSQGDLTAINQQQQAQAQSFFGSMFGGGGAGGAAAPVAAAPAPAAAPIATAPAPGPVSSTPLAPPALDPIYTTAAASSGIPKNVLLAKDFAESGFNANATPGVDANGNPLSTAAGIPQILASTADAPGYNMQPLGAANRTNNAQAIPFGANYLAARGQSIFGKDWDPTNQTQMRTALMAYNGNTATSGDYADKILAQSGLSAPAAQAPYQVASANTGSMTDVNPPVGPPAGGGAAAAAPTPTPGAPGQMPPGFQQAQQYRQAAMQAAVSPDPYIRAQAPYLMQQATTFMQMGAWGTPVAMPNGQYVQRNQISGEMKWLGAPRSLTKDAQDNLVDNDGNIIAPSRGYTQGPPVPGGGTMFFGPDGKPLVIASPARPETQFANMISDVMTKINSGQPLTQADKSNYTTAYQQLYPITSSYNAQRDQVISVQTKQPPAGTMSPDQLPGVGVKPGASPSPTPIGGPAPVVGAPSATPLPGPGVRQMQVVQSGVQNQMDTDQKNAAEATAAAALGRPTLANTQAIRDVLPQVTTGLGGDARLKVGQVLQAMGSSPQDVTNFTGTNPVSGELLQKNLMNLVADRVRQLGSREAGSVVQMFVNNYPSMLSRPDTIDAMTRIMDMDQQFKSDRADAQTQWINQQRANLGQPGAQLSDYNGMNGFSQSFDATHDPRTYVAAALAAARQPYSTWSSGLSGPMMTQALKLATRQYPNAQIYHPNGQLYQAAPVVPQAAAGGG